MKAADHLCNGGYRIRCDDVCAQALNEAIARHAPQKNHEYGSRQTASRSTWITTLTETGRRISMDGRRRCLNNIVNERLWR
jgi:putative transposase